MSTTQSFQGIERPTQAKELELTGFRPQTPTGMTRQRVEELVDRAIRNSATTPSRTEMLKDPVLHADALYGRQRPAPKSKSASEELDDRAHVLAAQTGCSYHQAYAEVLDRSPELYQRYRAEQDGRRFDGASAEAETMELVKAQRVAERGPGDAWETELDDLAHAYEARHQLEEGSGKAHILRQRPDLQEKMFQKLDAPASDGTALTEITRQAVVHRHLHGGTKEQAFVHVLENDQELGRRVHAEWR